MVIFLVICFSAIMTLFYLRHRRKKTSRLKAQTVRDKRKYDELTADLSKYIAYQLSLGVNPEKKIRKVTVVPEFFFADDAVSGMTDAQLAKKAIKSLSKKQLVARAKALKKNIKRIDDAIL